MKWEPNILVCASKQSRTCPCLPSRPLLPELVAFEIAHHPPNGTGYGTPAAHCKGAGASAGAGGGHEGRVGVGGYYEIDFSEMTWVQLYRRDQTLCTKNKNVLLRLVRLQRTKNRESDAVLACTTTHHWELAIDRIPRRWMNYSAVSNEGHHCHCSEEGAEHFDSDTQ